MITSKQTAFRLRQYTDVHEEHIETVEEPRSMQRIQQLRRQASSRLLSLLPPVILALFLLLAWFVTTATGRINSILLPSPIEVSSSFVDGWQSGVFLTNAWITIQESLLGFLLAICVSFPLGYSIAKSRFIATTLQPYLAAGQAIPAIVLAPFLYLLLPGTGFLAVIVVCLLVVLFPMVMNVILGVQTLDRALLDAARVEGASNWKLLIYIEFPLALPALLTALRTGLTLSITGAIVGEFICSPDRGLGGLVQIALNQYNKPFMFATVLVLALLAALYYSLSWLLVRLANVRY